MNSTPAPTPVNTLMFPSYCGSQSHVKSTWRTDPQAQDPSLCPRYTYPRWCSAPKRCLEGSPPSVPTGSFSKLASGSSFLLRVVFLPTSETLSLTEIPLLCPIFFFRIFIDAFGHMDCKQIGLKGIFFLLKCFLHSYLEGCVCVCDGKSIHFQRPIHAFFLVVFFFFILFSFF